MAGATCGTARVSCETISGAYEAVHAPRGVVEAPYEMTRVLREVARAPIPGCRFGVVLPVLPIQTRGEHQRGACERHQEYGEASA